VADDEYDFDPWELGTGLPDKLTVRIDNPHFGFDAQLADGTRCAFFLEGTVTAGTEDGGEFSQWYTLGEGWEPASKGTRLVREDGKRSTKINNQSNYGRLVRSLTTAAEAQGLTDVLRKRGNPFETRLWDGLELYLEREEYEFTDMQTKEKRSGSRLNVGRIEKVPGAEAQVEESNLHGPGDLQPKTKAGLRKLAKEVKARGGSHNEFAELAFSDVDGVLDNPVAEDAVMNQDEGSIWASA